jgi:hypothetical protein
MLAHGVRVLVMLGLLVSGCTASLTDAVDPRGEPAYPGATVVRNTQSGGTCCFYPDDGTAECPVWVTDYGTDNPPERVIQFYMDSGFVEASSGSEDGRIRWIAVHPGNPQRWRKVDITSPGEGAGVPDSVTVVEVMSADCDRSTESPETPPQL